MRSRIVLAGVLAAALAACAPGMSNYPGRVTEVVHSERGTPATSVFSTKIDGGSMIYGLSVLAAPTDEVVVVFAEYPNFRMTPAQARRYAGRIESLIGGRGQVVLGPYVSGSNAITRIVVTESPNDWLGFSYQWGRGRTWSDRSRGDYKRVRIERDYMRGFALALRRAASIIDGSGS